ncbi:hypothetical protein HW555_006819 [Spodoptera exigua]|uniref:Uncharacterized protein n=1 Tax=Spodoptera exigua TaxID=7107 RepID=A0A835GDY8_SPOEX|nr:hypothetical protein HW555_006819 [Spodoptera exigua]
MCGLCVFGRYACACVGAGTYRCANAAASTARGRERIPYRERDSLVSMPSARCWNTLWLDCNDKHFPGLCYKIKV